MADKTTHIILGATGGIGSELCRHLSKTGTNLVLAARDEDKLKKLGDELGAESHSLDATKSDEVTISSPTLWTSMAAFTVSLIA